MNKLTLLSLSLLMISACTAVNEDSTNQQKSETETPTHYIFRRLKKAKNNHWCHGPICNKSIKDSVLNPTAE